MKAKLVSERSDLEKQIIQWSLERLLSLGYTLKSNLPETVKNTPWSYVIRFETYDGYIYLKHTPDLIAFEVDIIKLLHEKLHANVPQVIANNAELNCFLMKDAGSILREILKQNFDVKLLCRAVDQFTLLQLASADYINTFIDIGVPDWRLDKLPGLYAQLLTQKDILIADGLSEKEISKLEDLLPTVSSLCKKLSEYSIKQTIVQPDFNDNNTLVDHESQVITTIDLGEIVISHPFFSLFNLLDQMKGHHALTEGDDKFLIIKHACFKNYMNSDSEVDFIDAFATAQLLWMVYWSLAQYRLMLVCGVEKIRLFQPGRLSQSLKEFIITC